MSKQKQLEKQDQKIRRLYTLIWFLACPLIYVITLLLGFAQINVVYWTLLLIPVLLGGYNITQVPPTKKAALPAVADGGQDKAPKPAQEEDEQQYVTAVQRAKLIALALKAPVIIAAPILITVVTHTIMLAQ